jgi:hypothetical protein
MRRRRFRVTVDTTTRHQLELDAGDRDEAARRVQEAVPEPPPLPTGGRLVSRQVTVYNVEELGGYL